SAAGGASPPSAPSWADGSAAPPGTRPTPSRRPSSGRADLDGRRGRDGRDGVVLAGGAGRRLGRAKATVVLVGRTLVERAVDALAPHCGRIVVVTRAAVPLPPLDAETVLDGPGPPCPLNGLATGLAAGDSEQVLVLASHLP